MYNKEGRIQLETTAHIQKRLDTNIQFYNTDIGTADLVFNVTRNGSPLLVSSENADVFIKLETTDKRKNYIVDTVLPVDPMNGKLKYTIPNDFLGLANKDNKTVKVVGQTWIAVRGKEDIVTHVEFSFSIKDSIINTIPAVDKLNEIRTFQEFRENIMTTINEINEALANGEDYVSQMEGTKASGMKALNDRTTQAVNELNTISDSSVSSLNDLFTTISNDLTTKSESALSDIDNAKREVLSMIDSLVTQEELENKIQSALSDKNYQEYKLTDENGKRQWLGTIGSEGNQYTSVLQLPPGYYECTIPSDAISVDAPQDPNGGSYIAEIDVYEGSNRRKQYKLVANSRNDEYRATVHTSTPDNPNGQFRGWKKVQNEEEYNALFDDTGWIDWNTMNGATKRDTDNPNALQCQRRIRTVNGVKIAHLRVNVNNLESGMVLGQIPSDMSPKIQNFYVRTPVNMNPAVLLVDIDGTLKFYNNLNDRDKWLPGHYIIGEFSWIIDDIGGGQ
ncbi:BppU family phage baseplate upper protein [Mammaliicoccus lentus]|uniref:BppU family phage baseplate upper protein n=1 Tax=Mammaliicoccus lentus TaxID=42858 RepID=UPI002DB8EE24|nr:BppU family phage baseplate upper protein [Mammaliicoccus lentus]MEB8091832.1 phage baseplate upper protein [Mammaliicoccus lentus]